MFGYEGQRSREDPNDSATEPINVVPPTATHHRRASLLGNPYVDHQGGFVHLGHHNAELVSGLRELWACYAAKPAHARFSRPGVARLKVAHLAGLSHWSDRKLPVWRLRWNDLRAAPQLLPPPLEQRLGNEATKSWHERARKSSLAAVKFFFGFRSVWPWRHQSSV